MNRPSTIPSVPPSNIPPELAACERYRIVKELGAGGMGVVYLAENLDMGRRLEAIKVIIDAQLRDPDARKRFEQEIEAVAGLNHPNIVTAYSVLRLPSMIGFAMEYVPGQDLDAVVRKRGPLGIADACGIVRQVAKGLQHAFQRHRVHRDIKPSNLMLSQGTVKILDFGLAKAYSEGTNDRLTSAGKTMGTPHYVAPEQLLDAAKADIRADIYSLGCTLFFLLTQRTPFTGSHFAVYRAHCEEEPPRLNLIRPDVPIELAEVVAKMLAKEPAKRYQQPREVIDSLAPLLAIRTKPMANVVPATRSARDTGPPRTELESTAVSLTQTTPVNTPEVNGNARTWSWKGWNRRAALAGLLIPGLAILGLFGLNSGNSRFDTPKRTIAPTNHLLNTISLLPRSLV